MNYSSNLIKTKTLFRGDDNLFKEQVKKVEVYGEYGCGESTKWVLRNTNSYVISVDTSHDWINKVKENISIEQRSRLLIHHTYLGKLGNWGTPLDYSRADFFSDYTNFLFTQIKQPELILIDGRFRVCCFLTCLKFAKEGTIIIFDDYINRKKYHFVEKYVPRKETCGYQSMFEIPSKNNLDFEELNKDIKKFRKVMK